MSKISIKNKKASFLYEFLDTYTAGIVLSGAEIKSIRNGKASINEAYCVFEGENLLIRNMYIAPYDHATHFNHEERRDRQLLLNKIELDKWKKKMKVEGITIIPRSLFISGKGWAKIDIALCKGKKLHDKREDLKNKDAKRDLDRLKKQF